MDKPTPTLFERVQLAVMTQLFRIPDAALTLLFGPPVRRDGHELDRQTQLLIKLNQLLGGDTLRFRVPLDQSRRLFDLRLLAVSPPPAPMHAVEDIALPGPAAPIPARVYRPSPSSSPSPAVVYLHGGGWVEGCVAAYDHVCRALAAATACTVISIDYRRAPEHPFPAAFDDAVAAFRAIAVDAARLHLDPARLAVAGDSAGGNLAALVARHTRGDAVRPCFQLLIYPGTDMTMTSPSTHSLGQGFLLTRAQMEWFRAQYMPPTANLTDPRASPLHEPDLSDLPPALVVTAGFDPLRDEGHAYAARLREAGTYARDVCYGPLIHGFFCMTGVLRAARPAFDDTARALRDALRA